MWYTYVAEMLLVLLWSVVGSADKYMSREESDEKKLLDQSREYFRNRLPSVKSGEGVDGNGNSALNWRMDAVKIE